MCPTLTASSTRGSGRGPVRSFSWVNTRLSKDFMTTDVRPVVTQSCDGGPLGDGVTMETCVGLLCLAAHQGLWLLCVQKVLVGTHTSSQTPMDEVTVSVSSSRAGAAASNTLQSAEDKQAGSSSSLVHLQV